MIKWKEAASVILCAANTSVSISSRMPMLGVNGKVCSEAIETTVKDETDFRILALKKSRDSPFTPGAYVFPGGKTNKSDSSIEWSDIFLEFGFSINKLCYSLKNESTGLPVFESNAESLPRCLSLRITAIRETFEESGILLCRKATYNSLYFHKAKHIDVKESMTWRRKIMKNSNEFINLCREYKCYPDVHSLYLWSNWLTPPNIPIRFDSVFFVAVLENEVPGESEDYEIEMAKWGYPRDILLESYDKTIDAYLPPPQFYELSRLSSINKMSPLIGILDEMNKSKHARWMPIRVYASDGELSILPGDELYPDNPDYLNHQFILKEDQSIVNLRGFKMHRFEHQDVSTKETNGIPRYNRIIITNVDNKIIKHIQPWSPSINAKL